jgi:hypothetical protein
MKWPALAKVALVTALAMAAQSAAAQESASPDHQSDDRLIFGANGATVSNASGGGGAAATWLHGFAPGTLMGVGAEYQTIANAHWTLGSVMGAMSLGPESGPRTNLSAELHEGAGNIAGRRFTYSLVVVGASRPLTGGLSLQLEDRRIDIDRSHGDLPKIGFTYTWTPKFQSSLGYAHSAGGNLGTEMGSARIDYFGAHTSFLAGVAGGKAAPAVLNLQTGIIGPGPTLKEAFVGFSRPYGRINLQLVADYVKLAATERVTLNLTCTLPLRGRGASR